MAIPLTLTLEVVDNFLSRNEYSSLAIYLNGVFKLQKDETGKPLKYEFSENTLKALHKILLKVVDENINEAHKDILKELFRSLRNYVINPEVQNFLTNCDNFHDDVRMILDLCAEKIPEVVQIILQFLINLIISNEKGGSKIYRLFSNEIFLLLKRNLHIYETTALLYNLSVFQMIEMDCEKCICILELYEENNAIEFLQFLVEKIITYDYFWNYYSQLDINKRLIILGIIRHIQIKGEKLNLPVVAVKTITDSFVNSGSVIFQTVSSSGNNLEPCEVSELLQVISSLCGNEEYLKNLQSDKNLLINSGVLLINIHRLGKQSVNCFTSIQSLAEIREPQKSIHEHPAFGFKADLIRIIGNLCWKNRVMQDLVREAELIPVILDCCNMDARNPFIMQWVILAVHNLCENNLDNQKIIAGLHQEGAVSSSVLEEMGLTLHSEEDKSIKIIPLETLKNRK